MAPAPEPGRSSLIWWFLGLLLAGFLILSFGGLIAARYFIRSIHVQESGDRVQIETPVGSLKVEKSDDVDPGLPVYPGSTVTDPGATIELAGPQDQLVAVTVARYRTTDPIEKVDPWYAEQLGAEFTREGAGVVRRKKEIFGIQVRSEDVAFISEKEDLILVVALERKRGATEIALARLGKDSPL